MSLYSNGEHLHSAKCWEIWTSPFKNPIQCRFFVRLVSSSHNMQNIPPCILFYFFACGSLSRCWIPMLQIVHIFERLLHFFREVLFKFLPFILKVEIKKAFHTQYKNICYNVYTIKSRISPDSRRGWNMYICAIFEV